MNRYIASMIIAFSVLLGASRSAMAVLITLVPTDLNPGDAYHLVFVTSTTRDATSADITVYDAFVQAAADAAGGGLQDITWLAIGSTPPGGVDAINHINVLGPVYRLDDTRVADNSADLWDGSLLAGISITEFGDSLLSDVWTGTNAAGIGENARSCFPGCTSHELGTTDKPQAAFGQSGLTDTRWIFQGRRGAQDRDNSLSFYGISAALTVPVPEPSTLALFVTGLAGLGFMMRRRQKIA